MSDKEFIEKISTLNFSTGMKPFIIPGTEKVITNSEEKRAYMRENGLVEIGNEKPAWMAEEDYKNKHSEKSKEEVI